MTNMGADRIHELLDEALSQIALHGEFKIEEFKTLPRATKEWIDAFIIEMQAKGINPSSAAFNEELRTRQVETYELLVELKSKLLRDNYIRKNDDVSFLLNKNFFVTVEGRLFLLKGGYVKEMEHRLHQSSRLDFVTTATLHLTRWIAVGTSIAAIYYLIQIVGCFWHR